jgi:hypothetical protein
MAIGEIIQVIGPSVDIRFGHDELPNLLNAVKVEYPDKGINLTLEVAQQIGNNTVRCVALGDTEGLVRGMKVSDMKTPIKVPVGPQTLGRIFNVLGETIDGIKDKVVTKEKYPIFFDSKKQAEEYKKKLTIDIFDKDIAFKVKTFNIDFYKIYKYIFQNLVDYIGRLLAPEKDDRIAYLKGRKISKIQYDIFLYFLLLFDLFYLYSFHFSLFLISWTFTDYIY